MTVMYQLLESDGWTQVSGLDNEWTKGGYDVEFSHRMGTLTVRHRPAVRQEKKEDSSSYYTRRQQALWHGVITQGYGDDRAVFEEWLRLQFQALSVSQRMHASGAKAPGE